MMKYDQPAVTETVAEKQTLSPLAVVNVAILTLLFAVAGFFGAKAILGAETTPKKRLKASKTQSPSSGSSSSGLKVQNGNGTSLQGGGTAAQNGLGTAGVNQKVTPTGGSNFSVQ